MEIIEVNGERLKVEKPRGKLTSIIAPIIAIVTLLALWEILIIVFEVPSWMIAKPTDIFVAFVENWSELLWPATLETLKAILLGYIIVVPLGFFLAIVMTQFRIVNNALNPYVILCVTTPLIILVPLLIVLIGYGFKVRLIAVIIQSFSIVMMNSATGFNNVDPLRLELMQSLGASRVQRLVNVIIPSSWEDIFTGCRLGAIFATTAAISAEFSGGNGGLGFIILYYTTTIKVPLAFAGIMMVAMIGILLYLMVGFVEKKVIKWSI